MRYLTAVFILVAIVALLNLARNKAEQQHPDPIPTSTVEEQQ